MLNTLDFEFLNFITDFRIKVKEHFKKYDANSLADYFVDNQRYCPFSRYSIYVGFNYKFSCSFNEKCNTFYVKSCTSHIPFTYNTFLDIVTDIYICITLDKYRFYK